MRGLDFQGKSRLTVTKFYGFRDGIQRGNHKETLCFHTFYLFLLIYLPPER